MDDPVLSDEAAAGVYDFLQAFMMAFESGYLHQLKQYDQQGSIHKKREDLI